MGGMGMGMGGDEKPEKTPTALGRLYMLTKLYYRLSAIHHVLLNNSDKVLVDLTNQVSEAFDILKMIIANLKSYKSKADEIIVTYYEYLQEVIDYLEKYYKGKYDSEQ